MFGGRRQPQQNPYANQQGGNPPPPQYRSGTGTPGGQRTPQNFASHTMKVASFPVQEKASQTKNLLAVPPGSFRSGSYVICDDRFVFTCFESGALADGQSPRIGAGGAQRQWAQWSIDQPVSIAPYDIFEGGNKNVYLGSIDLEIGFVKAMKSDTQYDETVLSKRFLDLYKDQIFSPGQLLYMDFGGVNFVIKVLRTVVVDLANSQAQAPNNTRGILIETTEISFAKSQRSDMQLKSSGTRARTNAIINPSFKFEDMGIGGLDAEFNIIFRRAFTSRICPPRVLEKLGINHVKGLLLFGPPGTGKTLIARKIGQMLNAVEPKIVNGPEMLNKYVGGSEENIRNLFKDAEAEYKSKGEESNLHIIIFDELDAVFKQRGSRGDGTGVGDNVVNQLLAKMDGVEQLNNILVIGMTNRRDLIDSALLRPGRFEVQLEISLPDEKGRQQIFKIHTRKMREEGALAKDVSIEELASLTKNYSGAEIEGLVKSAASYALNRNMETDPSKGIHFDNKEVIVNRADFMNALDETKSAFGVSEEDISNTIRGGIIKYATHIDDILKQGDRLIEQLRQDTQFPVVSVLVHGPPGSGKTALAASIALSSNFPFIRLISPENVNGMSEAQRIQYITNQFQDSYKSPLNVILIDSIEDIMDWVDIGPRFSNPLLQTLKVVLQQMPPKERRLLVLCTTSNRQVLAQMGMLKCFRREIYVPNLASTSDMLPVFEQVNFLNEQERQAAIDLIEKKTESSVLGMGIKDLLFNIKEASLFKGDKIKEFADLIVGDIESKPGHQQK